MEISAGARLAHFEVKGHLGSGAMGEVWRALDTRLDREVALKVLPSAFCANEERLARLAREARLLASLEHPNIASVHGFEEVDGARILVMQLVEGKDLAARLAAGSLPLDDVISIAHQICEGLEAAHEQGIVHRDLKPANIMVDDFGKVVLLDFGLARAAGGESAVDPVETSAPTQAYEADATAPGMVLGTAAYMSPEQARGRPVDKRADIWAFGVVLWEMLTGERLFAGPSFSDTLAAVLTREVDCTELSPHVPSRLRQLVERCLDRDPHRRLRDIGEARIELSGDLADRYPPTPVSTQRSGGRLGWAVILTVALAVGVLVFFGLIRWSSSEPEPERSLNVRILLTENQALSQSLGASAVLSPDGNVVAFVASDEPSLLGTARSSADRQAEDTRIYLQRWTELGAVPLAGTEKGTSPFFSPDGQSVAFFAGGSLRWVSVGGGAVKALAEAPDPRGGTWGVPSKGGAEAIVFAPGFLGPLWIVTLPGGEPRQLTVLDPNQKERSHRWPAFLPDGRHVVFSAQDHGSTYEKGSLRIVDTRDGAVREVGLQGAYPRVTPSGHLLWAREGALQAAAFDLATLEVVGPTVRVIDDILSLSQDQAMDDGTAHYAFSDEGRLIYRSGRATTRESRPVWLDRNGREISRSRHSRIFGGPSIGPKGERVALPVSEPTSENNIWIWTLEEDVLSRLTFSAKNAEFPSWSPDGKKVYFGSNPLGLPEAEMGPLSPLSVHSKAADGSGEEIPFIESSAPIRLLSVTRDGRNFLAQQMTAEVSWDLVTLEAGPEGVGDPTPFVSSPANDGFPRFSPDGRWVVYMSNESGTMQVIVRSFGGPSGQWQIGDGFFPRWTKGGEEVVFLRGREMVRTSVDVSSGTPRFGPVESLFSPTTFVDARPPFDVTEDGERFLLLVAEEDQDDAVAGSVILVTDFFDQLRMLAPRAG